MNEEKRTALIVDDEEMILDLEALMLQKNGFDTLTASNSAEACQVYQDVNGNVDLVVLDMVMPDENGATTYRRLKRINPDIKVLISTGYGRDGNVEEILNDAQNGFIQKPLRFKEFTSKVDTILSMD